MKVRKGGGEEIPLVQGKEQWLRFAGAAVKRYPTPKVRETHIRRWMLQEGIRGPKKLIFVRSSRVTRHSGLPMIVGMWDFQC